MPKVSVIMPCYNLGAFIEESVNSILAQTYNDWDLIIVNDGSTDPFTNKLLESYKPQKAQIYHTENKGVSAARNYGIQQSTSKYILPLDADDLIGKDYIKEAVEILESNSHIRLVYSKGVYFGAQAGEIVLPEYDPKIMLSQNLIFNPAMFRKSDWDECGGYDETFIAGWEDWDFWLRLVNHKDQVFKLPSTHYYYRIRSDSRNAVIQNKKQEIAEQQVYKKHLDKYLEYYPLPITQLRHSEYLKEEQRNFEEYKRQIYNSKSYKIGDFLLAPFKWLKSNTP